MKQIRESRIKRVDMSDPIVSTHGVSSTPLRATQYALDSIVCRVQTDLQRGKQPRAGICIDKGRRFTRFVQRVRVTQELMVLQQ